MIKHKDGWPFDRPITSNEIAVCHEICVCPDRFVSKSGLNTMKYTCNQEVLDDIRLVFQLLPVQHGGHRGGVPVQPAAREVLREGDQQDGALRGASQT